MKGKTSRQKKIYLKIKRTKLLSSEQPKLDRDLTLKWKVSKLDQCFIFIRGENITCKVISKNKDKCKGSEHSLSSAGLIATNRFGFTWKSVAGPLNWIF